jgi:hypothetical protein
MEALSMSRGGFTQFNRDRREASRPKLEVGEVYCIWGEILADCLTCGKLYETSREDLRSFGGYCEECRK